MAFSSVNRHGQNTKCMKRSEATPNIFLPGHIARALIQVTSAWAVYPRINVRQGKNSGWATTRAKAFLPGHLPWLAWCSAATDSIGFVPTLSVLLQFYRFCFCSIGFAPTHSGLLLFYRFCSYSIGFVPILSVLLLLYRFCSYSIGFVLTLSVLLLLYRFCSYSIGFVLTLSVLFLFYRFYSY